MHPRIREITENNLTKDLSSIRVGNTVKVTVRIKEGSKERNQIYEGTIIKTKGTGINKTFTVRRVFQGVGVERVFLTNSPKIEKIECTRIGKARRAKLYYLRKRTGKSTKLKETLSPMQGTEDIPKEIIPEEGKLVEVTT